MTKLISLCLMCLMLQISCAVPQVVCPLDGEVQEKRRPQPFAHHDHLKPLMQIAGKEGAEIIAPISGTIKSNKKRGLLKIEGEEFTVHLQYFSVLIESGEIQQGEKIGELTADYLNLHILVEQNGNYIDPYKVFTCSNTEK